MMETSDTYISDVQMSTIQRFSLKKEELDALRLAVRQFKASGIHEFFIRGIEKIETVLEIEEGIPQEFDRTKAWPPRSHSTRTTNPATVESGGVEFDSRWGPESVYRGDPWSLRPPIRRHERKSRSDQFVRAI